jgi:hypothetical protein
MLCFMFYVVRVSFGFLLSELFVAAELVVGAQQKLESANEWQGPEGEDGRHRTSRIAY